MTPSEEQVRTAVAQQAGTWFIVNQSGPLEQPERAAFVAWLKASPIHVEEYLGVALIAHDLPAAMDEPDLPLESLLEMARADDTNGVVSLEPPMRVRDLPSKQHSKPRIWSLATSTAAVVLMLAASVLWWLHDGDLLGLPKIYQTAHGEQIVAQAPRRLGASSQHGFSRYGPVHAQRARGRDCARPGALHGRARR